MTQAARRVIRARAVMRDGWRYPMLRLQARRPLAPASALQAVGFDEKRLSALAEEFDQVADGLYARLAEAAREAGDAEAERRVAAPSASSRGAKQLLYLAIRIGEPSVVVETGAFHGASTAFMLEALEQNGQGRLLSFDVADARDALGVPLPHGREPAWLVPDELRGRLELVIGDVRRTLGQRLATAGTIDLFVHDSLHTFRQMTFEYRVAWRHLRPGGVLLSDDVFWNPAFWLFTTVHRVPFAHTGTVGLTRKPL